VGYQLELKTVPVLQRKFKVGLVSEKHITKQRVTITCNDSVSDKYSRRNKRIYKVS
jgi:hypothetical protein